MRRNYSNLPTYLPTYLTKCIESDAQSTRAALAEALTRRRCRRHRPPLGKRGDNEVNYEPYLITQREKERDLHRSDALSVIGETRDSVCCVRGCSALAAAEG